MTRLIYETHMHTPLCKHADGEVEAYAQIAFEKGLRGITVTCHNPLPDGFGASVRMNEDQFDEYLAMIQRARAAFEGKIDVRLGLEFDYVPGFEDYLEKQIRWASFDYRLGSVHPQMPDYRNLFDPGDAVGYQKVYFDHLAKAAESGFFHAISHPDLIKNFTVDHWDPYAIEDTIDAALDRIAATGCSMELNTSGLQKAIAEMNPCPMMLKKMFDRGIGVVVGADAHVPRRVGADYAGAYDLLETAGYDRVGWFLSGKRQELAICDARASLVEAGVPR